MIKESLRETVKDGNKAITRLRRVSEQALYPEQSESVKLAMHHLKLAMKYTEDAFNVQVEKEIEIIDDADKKAEQASD